jgi:hypothetical protein
MISIDTYVIINTKPYLYLYSTMFQIQSYLEDITINSKVTQYLR